MNGSIDTATFGWLWPVIPSHAHTRHIYQTGLATDASRRLTWLKEDLEAVRGNTADDGHCKIRGIRKVHQIITKPNKPNGARAYSSSLLHAIIAQNQLPFFKMFPKFCTFLPNLSNISTFFQHFFPFFLKNHNPYPYLLQKALGVFIRA